MAGPWEKYQNSASTGSGPWAKYGTSTEPAASLEVGDDQIVQEMHPSVSMKDRFVIKNFSNQPDVGTKYLKSKIPDADVRYEKGQYLIKGKSDDKYRVVDPNTGFFSSDFFNDVTDLGYDAVDAGITTAGTTVGALGGLAAGGVGALPGAVVGGGVSGAASEALR